MVIQKPIDLPPDVAERFVEDMRAFYAEEDATKQGQRSPLKWRFGNIFRNYFPHL